ncbi:MAG: hypothetical protein IT196_19620 [Acidimicrobiales bacterium]|nr:hypothetical protein [Acidimicrobiales bacterium]
MTDELDRKLAADATRLFSGGDLDAARANVAVAQARAQRRRRRRLTASAGSLAVFAAVTAGALTLNRRGSQQLTVGDTTTADAGATDPSTSSPGPEVGTAIAGAAAPLADDLEGMVFGSPHLQVTGEDVPRTEEGPGLPGVSLTFYRGTVTWHNGCYSLTGTYEPGDRTLEMTFAGPDGVIRPAIACPDQELVSLLDEIVLARPAELATWSAPGAGLQLTVAGGSGVLHFGQQPYSAMPVHCVPGVDSLAEGIVSSGRPRDDVAWSDPVQAARAQLVDDRDLYQDVELDLTLANGTQALVTGTKDGRPVLSALLDANGAAWELTRYLACTPDVGRDLSTPTVTVSANE